MKKYFLKNNITYRFILKTGQMPLPHPLLFLFRLVVLSLCIPFVPFFNRMEKKRICRFREEGYVFHIGKRNVKFYLPQVKYGVMAGDTIQGDIFFTGDYYEEDFLNSVRKYIKKDMTLLDIGGNIGNHTVYFEKECGAAFVYVFEPVEKTGLILEKNIQLNGLTKKTEVVHAALGSETSRGSIKSYNPENLGGTKIQEDEDGSIRIISLDSMKIEKKIGLIKIDVEGFECEVLKGGEKTIKRDLPVICIEIQPCNRQWVLDFMNEISYEEKESFDGYNYIFAPDGELQ